MNDPTAKFATPRIASGVLFVDGNRLLLVHKTRGNGWDIPGGYVDAGESPAAACRRELLEELGIEREVCRLLAVDWAPHADEGDKILYVFDCGDLGADGKHIQLTGGELDRWEWVPMERLSGYVIPRLVRRLVSAYQARQAGTGVYLEHGTSFIGESLAAMSSSAVTTGRLAKLESEVTRLNEVVNLVQTKMINLSRDRPAVGSLPGSPVDQAGARATESGEAERVRPGWTVDIAEDILRRARPTGSVFLRALVDEGGTATAARLKELTGSTVLHYMTLTLSSAARQVFRSRDIRWAGHRFVQSRRDPGNPSSPNVYEYVLPAELVPIFDAALRRLGR